MAQLLNKDPDLYKKEADGFLSDLRGFHAGRGTALQRTPKIGGKDVDLYLLYVLVTTRGGWEKVNDFSEWDTLAPLFNVPMACVNVGLALKQIYLRYLDHYEKVHFHGEEVYARHEEEMIMHDTTSRSSRRHNIRALNAVAMSYNAGQHVVSETLRSSLNMAEPRRPSEYDRLVLSLLSPLPNEQDFAINLCTLLSNEGKHELQLSRHPRLLGALLAHAGVFTDGYTQRYMLENYSRTKRQSLVSFWRDSLSEKKLLRLLSVSYAAERRPQTGCGAGARDAGLLFSPARAELHQLSDSEDDEDSDAALDAEVAALSLPGAAEVAGGSGSDDELFCLGAQLGQLERTGHRVLQVAQLLRSLSFQQENSALMAASAACLRFLLLCAHCRWGSLSSCARDTLGNVAGEVVLRDAASDRLGRLLLQYVGRGVQQPDRSVVLASLEVLNKLAQNERNEEALASALEARLLHTVCTYLSLHDILLLITSLECLLGLTSLGEDTCRAVARAPGAVSSLISLVTVEAQSYGPRACILMKVMQTPCLTAVSAATSTATSTATAAATATATSTTSASAATSATTQASASPAAAQQAPSPAAAPQPPATPKPPPPLSQPHNPGHPAAAATPPLPPRPVTPQRLPQQPAAPAAAAAVAVPQAAVVPVRPPQLQQQPTVVRQVPMPIIQPGVKLGTKTSALGTPTENGLWTVKWLQTVCELSGGQSIEQGVLYKQYTASAAAQHWKGVLTQAEFANCVKSVFGSGVTAVAKRLPHGQTEYHFEGLRSKLQIVTTVVQQQQQQPRPAAPLTSSILKAQLSAPPRPHAEPQQPPQPPAPAPAVTTQVARNMQNKRLAVNGVSEGPDPDPAAAGDGPLPNGVRGGSGGPDSRPGTPASGEGLLADLLEKKVTPMNGIDKELRIGEKGLELVNNNNGSSGDQAATPPPAVNGGGQSPAKRNGTDLLASALDMAGLMDDLGVMDDDDPPPATPTPPPVAPTPPPPPPPPPPPAPPVASQGFKRAADSAGGGEPKRAAPLVAGAVQQQQVAAAALPQQLQTAITAQGQQVVMVPQSMANMVLKLPAGVQQGQQLLLPQGQLMMTSSGQLVLGQQQAQVMVQGGGTGNVVVGQPAVGQPQTVLVAQTPQQQGTPTRTLIFLPPHQKMYQVTQPGQTHHGQVMVQVTRAPSGATQVVNTTVVTGSRAAQQHIRGQPQPIVTSQPAAVARLPVQAPTRAPTPPPPPPPPAPVVRSTPPPPPPPPPAPTPPAPPPPPQTTARSAQPAVPPPQPPPPPAVARAPSVAPTPESVVRHLPAGLLCEWRGCLRGFPTAHAVYQHAIETHCPPHQHDIPCLWERCDGMIRKRYSMMTHLQDRHCSEPMLRLMRRRREQLQATGKTDIPTPSAPPPHPGYANNAALQAIRRHALTEAKPPPDEKEGPVTKSIRLTAALILRNIAVFSQHGRRILRGHESHLLNIAASSAESSRTIGQLLADLHEADPS